jgi:acyl dehydratase
MTRIVPVMHIPEGLVGTTVGPLVQEIDARWLMAYAAALGDVHAEYLDTTRPEGVIGHPIFPVCYEWPLAVELRASALSERIAVRSVHATHDLRLHRRARAGDRLSTTATVISSEPRAPGAYVVTRLETVDTDGRSVSTTDYGSIYRGVQCERAVLPPGVAGPSQSRGDVGAARELEHRGDGSPRRDWCVEVPVPAGLAHTYTECARIWNPIHTDKAVARSAGLADIILHGTATLALAVSAALERAGVGPAAGIARITCRFTGMVPLPSVITVEGWKARLATGEEVIAFQVLGADGRPVLRDGRLIMAGSHDPQEARA